jgi:hypothetical protein
VRGKDSTKVQYLEDMTIIVSVDEVDQ